MRLTLIGDSHGYDKFISKALREAKKFDSDAAFQLGDFGYWEHTKNGVHFLNQCELSSKYYGIPFFWLDGNHENHPLLWNKYQAKDHEFSFGTIFCAKIREGVYYLPRGTSFEIESKKFLVLGGAFSVDKDYRLNEMSLGAEDQWWDTELITDSDLNKALSVGKADIVFSHDVPTCVDLEACYRQKDSFWQTRENRDKLQTLWINAQPELWIHGHYHWPYMTKVQYPFDNEGKMDWFETRFVGLDCNFNLHKAIAHYEIGE